MSTYPHRPKAEAFDNAVDVVELLLVQTDQAPNIRHLRFLQTFSSMTSQELLIQQSVEGEFCEHDGDGDGDGEVIRAKLRLSTTTI